MLVNVSNLNTLFTGFKGNFQAGFAKATPTWNQIATLITSATETELYAFLGMFPQMREWLGDRHVKNMAANKYSLVNKPYEATVGVPATKIEDDTYGIFAPIIEEMGYSAAMHPDELVYAALAAGISSLCYDGQYFFDTDHPVIVDGAATTKSNYDSTTGTITSLWCLLDTKRPLKPFIYQERQKSRFQTFTTQDSDHVFKRNEFLYGVDDRCAAGYGLWQLAYASKNNLNDTNVQTYVAAMMALKSDEGKPLNIVPDLCVVGPSRWAEARALFMVPTLAGGAANPNYGLCKVLVSPFLT